MKNVAFWDLTTCGSCKNRRFGGTYPHITFLRSALRLLGIANIVPTSPILVSMIMEATCPSEMSVLTRATRLTSLKTAFFIEPKTAIVARRPIRYECCAVLV
jgi:hypothetical protein